MKNNGILEKGRIHKMNNIEITKELLSFIQDSPSMFHSIKTIRTYLDKDGFTYLPEGKTWTVEKGGKYYTIRKSFKCCCF